MPWTIQPSSTFVQRFQDYGNRFPQTRTALMCSVSRYLELLNRDVDPYSNLIPFRETIRKGIVTISEEETMGPDRIYAYPDRPMKVVHLLSIGHRDHETEDLLSCEIQIEKLNP
jgi:hypothetical protein